MLEQLTHDVVDLIQIFQLKLAYPLIYDLDLII